MSNFPGFSLKNTSIKFVKLKVISSTKGPILRRNSNSPVTPLSPKATSAWIVSKVAFSRNGDNYFSQTGDVAITVTSWFWENWTIRLVMAEKWPPKHGNTNKIFKEWAVPNKKAKKRKICAENILPAVTRKPRKLFCFLYKLNQRNFICDFG